MTFIEAIKKIGERKKERSEKFKELDENDRLSTLIETRKKPSNERELEQFIERDRQEKIKQLLEHYRNKERDEINFAHNPINVPNITNKSDFNILKEKRLFKQGNMFSNQKNIIKSNNKLLNNGKLGICR